LELIISKHYAQGNLNLNWIIITDSGILMNQGVPAAATIDDLPNEVTDDTVTLKWSEPENNGGVITQYTVYQRIVTNGTPGEWIKLETTADSVTEWTVELECCKVYEFVVTATNEFGESLKEEGKIERVKSSDSMFMFCNFPYDYSHVFCKTSAMTTNLSDTFIMQIFSKSHQHYLRSQSLANGLGQHVFPGQTAPQRFS